jgi:hypothetical protein
MPPTPDPTDSGGPRPPEGDWLGTLSGDGMDAVGRPGRWAEAIGEWVVWPCDGDHEPKYSSGREAGPPTAGSQRGGRSSRPGIGGLSPCEAELLTRDRRSADAEGVPARWLFRDSSDAVGVPGSPLTCDR